MLEYSVNKFMNVDTLHVDTVIFMFVQLDMYKYGFYTD